MPDQTITADDVARAAGVSRSTVSRAFSPGRSVQPRTRTRILEVAADLEYRPNALARALTSKRSQIIGIVMGELSNPFHAMMYQHLSRNLQSSGFLPISAQIGRDDDTGTTIDTFRQYQVDTVIMTSMNIAVDALHRMQDAGLHVMLVNRIDGDGITPSVCADLSQGGQLAARVLVEKGCRAIAVAKGAPDNWTSEARLEGHLIGLRKLGIDAAHVLDGGYTYANGAAVAQRLGQRGLAGIDGILCPNDLFAIGFLDALEPGRRDDLAVIGFDDIPMAAWNSYALTTIRLPVSAMASRAVEMIERARASDEPMEETLLIPCRLVARSTA